MKKYSCPECGGTHSDPRAERELLGAFDEAVYKRLPMHGETIFSAALSLLFKVIETSDDPNGMAQFAIQSIEALAQQMATNPARRQ